MDLLLVAPSGSRRPGTSQPSSAWHLGRCGTCPSVGRTGVRWAGARAEAGGRDPQGTAEPTRWSTTTRSRTTRDTATQAEPGTRSQTTPPRPRGTGHRTRPTRSTEQQDKQPKTQLSRPSRTHPAAQLLQGRCPWDLAEPDDCIVHSLLRGRVCRRTIRLTQRHSSNLAAEGSERPNPARHSASTRLAAAE